jgi:DNA modification methylase
MSVQILKGDCRDVLKTLGDASVDCCVTSPPYFGLRDYGHENQIGLETTPDAFVAQLVSVFREVRRVLKDTGTVWLNLGDSYAGGGRGGNPADSPFRKQATNAGSLVPPSPIPAGLKAKDLIGIPWRVAFALQADGWWLRQDIIWAKPNPMPESVTDRCTKAHEYIFMLTKSAKYFYDADAIAEDAIYADGQTWDERKAAGEPSRHGLSGAAAHGARNFATKQRGHGRRHAGFNERWDAMSRKEQCSGKRNKRSVWTVATKPFSQAHFATFPPDLIEPCILAGCPKDGIVLDPFGGAGTTGLVADRLGRNAILIELNPDYAAMAIERINGDAPLFGEVAA